MGINRERIARSTREFARGSLRLARENVRTLGILVAVVAFVLLLEEVAEGDIMHLDVMAYRFLVERLRSDAMTPVMEGFTTLASVPVVGAMTMLIAALAPGRAPGWCVAVNLVGVVAVNQLLKNLVQRPRPDGFRLAAEAGYSFPSGHSMVSMAFFGLVIWMVWRYHRHDVMRWVWMVLFGLIIAMVGISRVYLGVHYASDVIAGFCVALLWLVFYTKVIAPIFMPDPGDPGICS